MDWRDERYVRLYTRDTVTWAALPWQAQALFPQILRRVDRAGVLDTAGRNTAEALLLFLPGWPVEVLAEGVAGLLKEHVILVSGSAIVVPNFIQAQEAHMSDAARSREYRARRRDIATRESLLAPLASEPPSAPAVPSRHVTGPSRHVTRPARGLEPTLVAQSAPIVTPRDAPGPSPGSSVTPRDGTVTPSQIQRSESVYQCSAKDLTDQNARRATGVPEHQSTQSNHTHTQKALSPEPEEKLFGRDYQPDPATLAIAESHLDAPGIAQALIDLHDKLGQATADTQTWNTRFLAFCDGVKRFRSHAGGVPPAKGAKAPPGAFQAPGQAERDSGWFVNLDEAEP